MNKILKYSYFLTGLFLVANLGACVKDRNTNATDFTQIKPLVEIRNNISADGTNVTGPGNDAGLSNFTRASLNFSADSVVSFYVNLASEYTLTKDIVVTVGVDNAALDAYNGNPANGNKYELFPDSLFTLAQTTATIKAGERVALITVQFYPSKLDPTRSYMLPVSITDAQGTLISGNYGTIYYHVIGNPLAGSYLWDFSRWDNATGTGTLSGLSFTEENTTISATSATSMEVASGYYIQPRYEITFTNTNGVLSNFKVTLNADDVAVMLSAGVSVISGPTILLADPVNKHFKFQYTVVTGTPLNRYIIDEFYQ